MRVDVSQKLKRGGDNGCNSGYKGKAFDKFF